MLNTHQVSYYMTQRKKGVNQHIPASIPTAFAGAYSGLAVANAGSMGFVVLIDAQCATGKS